MSGRVTKCTQAAIATAEKLKRRGVPDKDVAACIGVRPETFCRWKNEPRTDVQRQFSQAVKKAESDGVAALLAIIMREANERDWKAAAWLLERRHPDEFGRKYVSANIEGSVKVEAISEETRAEMERLLGIGGEG